MIARMARRLPLLGLLIASLPGQVAAQTYPAITGELEIEVQNDRAYRVPEGARRLNDLFTTTELGMAFYATRELSIQSGFTSTVRFCRCMQTFVRWSCSSVRNKGPIGLSIWV